MRKFELFITGRTVYNKADNKNKEPKIIAYIEETGKIIWYVNPCSDIPSNVLLRVEHIANVQAEKWKRWFSALPEATQYRFFLDRLTDSDFLKVISDDMLDASQKIRYAERLYYKS